MSCPSPATLAAHRAGRLPAAEAAEVERHLQTCEACRALTPTEAGAAPAGAPLDLRPGQRLGRYVVLWELGRGGMGAVYAAFDPQLDRKVALKLLLPDDADDPARAERARTRLLREAQALARVSHPNTVAVHDAGTHEGRVFLALEHLSGRTLKTWVKERPRSWREVVAVLRQAGEGLQAVHAAGLVHRDFKPGNVLVTAEGKAKVLDFGLARLAVPTAAEPGDDEPAAGPLGDELTQVGVLCGTPGYLAPELLAGGAPTPATDQFAFGVTLYQCLFGQRPFGRAALPRDIARIQAGMPPVPPTGAAPPPWVQAVVRRCLAPEARDRFPDLAAALAALDADPARRHRRWLRRVSVTLAVLAALVFAWRHGEGPGCPTEAATREAVLPAGAHAALAARLSTPGTRALLPELDAQLTTWAREQVQACAEAQQRAAPVHTLQRSECLERRGLALAALAEVLSTAEPEVLARTAGLVEQQVGEDTCRRSPGSRVSDDVPLAQRPLAIELRRELLRARAQGLTGDLVGAVERDGRIVARATDAGLPGFAGEALVQQAWGETYAGHDDLALAHFQAGFARLLAAGIDEQAVLAGRGMVGLLAQRPDAWMTAHAVLEASEALWERVGRPRALEVELLGAHHALDLAEGRPLDALQHAQRRLALATEEFGPEALATLEAHGSLAIAYWEAGDLRRSNQEDALALALLERRQGPGNPVLLTRMLSLAVGLRHEGQRAEAQALLEKARAQAGAGRAGDAVPAAIDAELALLALGVDDARALALADACIANTATHSNPLELVKVLVTRARALTGLGRARDALADCARARALLAPLSDPGHKRQRSLLAAEGEARLALGEAGPALAAYEEAAALPPSTIPDERGSLRFGLARALRAAHRDPTRAAELARQAQADFAAFPGFERERQALDAFTAAPLLR